MCSKSSLFTYCLPSWFYCSDFRGKKLLGTEHRKKSIFRESLVTPPPPHHHQVFSDLLLIWGSKIRAKTFMSTGRPHHHGHLLQVKKESLPPLTLYTSFRDLINVYSRRSGADNPRGQNLDVKRNLVTSVICYKFQKNLFEVSNLYNFFHDFTRV